MDLSNPAPHKSLTYVYIGSPARNAQRHCTKSIQEQICLNIHEYKCLMARRLSLVWKSGKDSKDLLFSYLRMHQFHSEEFIRNALD